MWKMTSIYARDGFRSVKFNNLCMDAVNFMYMFTLKITISDLKVYTAI